MTDPNTTAIIVSETPFKWLWTLGIYQLTSMACVTIILISLMGFDKFLKKEHFLVNLFLIVLFGGVLNYLFINTPTGLDPMRIFIIVFATIFLGIIIAILRKEFKSR